MIPTERQFNLLYSDYQQLDTPERFGQFIFNRTGFQVEGSYIEVDNQKAWRMLRAAILNYWSSFFNTSGQVPEMLSATLPSGQIIEWPQGEMVSSTINSWYYIPSFHHDDYCMELWGGGCPGSDYHAKHGIAHLTKEAAAAHAKAMIFLSRGVCL